VFTFPVAPLWQRTRPSNAAGSEINCKTGLGMINALPRLNPAQEVAQSMGNRLLIPNPVCVRAAPMDEFADGTTE
jgi:hypothetical protein